MPFVVTANCIVCKDLEGDATAVPHAGNALPQPPEHLRPSASDVIDTTKKPDADDAASG
ncbi:MAG: hypothetical protein JSS23_08515 [Proteobacteria bacterium]|nr:hypothetical protein [Pseudomonadota bacterium]